MATADDLKSRIAEQNAVAVVGSGVSRGATGDLASASWGGLLRQGIERCVEVEPALEGVWASRRSHDLEGDLVDLLCVASQVEERLGAARGRYRRWLETSVGALRAKNLEVISGIVGLKVPIATLNYDTLIERTHHRSSVTWLQPHKIVQCFARKPLRDDVVHLHGVWDEPKSVVLGYRSYERLLSHDAAQAIQQAISALGSLVFIGCGGTFADPNFERWLDWARRTFDGGLAFPHYVLATHGEVATIRSLFRTGDSVEIVGYGDDVSSLAAFLQWLRPDGSSVPPGEAGLDSSSLSLQGQPPPRLLLPAVGALFGRVSLLEALVRAVSTEDPQAIAIRGVEGIGKTALVVTAIRDERVRQRFGPRRFFARCEALRTAADLHEELARATGAEGAGDPWKAACGKLEGAATLLVLDGIDQLLEGDRDPTEEVLSALMQIPALALVTTFRGHALPIGAGMWAALPPLTPLEPEHARQLLIYMAGPEIHQDPALERIVALCGGIPMTLKLVAGMAHERGGFQGLAEEWRGKISQEGTIAVGDTIGAVIGISERGSNGPLVRDLLGALRALPLGMAARDVRAIWQGEGIEAADELVARDIATRVGERYSLGAAVAGAAPETGMRASVPREVVDHYLGLCGEGIRLSRAGARQLAIRLQAELANLESILRDAVASGRWEELGPAIRGFGLLARRRGKGDPEFLGGVAEAALAAGEARVAVEALIARGYARRYLTLHEAATSDFERAIALLEADPEPDEFLVAECTRGLGEIAFARSDYPRAPALLEDAKALYERAGDRSGIGICIERIADYDLEHKRVDAAARGYEAAMAHYEASDDDIGRGNIFLMLGDVERERPEGDIDKARSLYSESHRVFEDLGIPLGEVNARMRIAELAMTENPTEARSQLEQALEIYERLGDRVGQGNCLVRLAQLEEAERAQGLLLGALRLYEQVPEPISIGLVASRLADMAETDQQSAAWRAQARAEWSAAGREDLLGELDDAAGTGQPRRLERSGS